MLGKFHVQKFKQFEDRFGIKTIELGEKWINGFGMCPQIIQEGEINTIPYYDKNGYFNYGEPKTSKIDMKENLIGLRQELDKIWDEIGEIKLKLDELQKD